jgi:hypothetical protein
MEIYMAKKEKQSSQFLQFLFISFILILISSGIASAQTVILNQPPNQIDASASDPDFPQTIAENFVVSSASNIIQIRIWGCYFSNLTSLTDNFTVIFHADSSGSPGAAISTQNNVPVVREVTGKIIPVYINLIEYVFTLTLATPVSLTPGTYWVEIYDNAATGDTFAWEKGTVDPTNGLLGYAYDYFTVPGSSWSTTTSDGYAIEITAEVIEESIPNFCYEITAIDENGNTNNDFWKVYLNNDGTGLLLSSGAQQKYNLYLFGGGPGWFNTSGYPGFVNGDPKWSTWIARGKNESGFLQPIGEGYMLTGEGVRNGNKYTVEGKRVPCPLNPT